MKKKLLGTSSDTEKYFQIVEFYEKKYSKGLKYLSDENLKLLEIKMLAFIDSIKSERVITNLVSNFQPKKKSLNNKLINFKFIK